MQSNTLYPLAIDQMEFGGAPVSAQSLTRQIVHHIRSQIAFDILKPGERVREQHISEQLNVSRTPLREALQILAAERLVVILPNRGAIVANPDVGEVRAMLDVYSTLEARGGFLACQHATAAQMASVASYHDRMRETFAAHDRIAYFNANQGFHLGIVGACGNPVLIQMHYQLNMRLHRIRYLAVMNRGEWSSASSEHGEILAAFLSRNGELLGKLLADHLNFAWRQAGGMETIAADPSRSAA
ncbi:GntR family transcriptional regulator [Paraburkholderia domus]|uniref:GntR family transcriptional regulator n=1 Tax=Paraburkholderia domus TaxID=2793075 RepID=UPI001913E57A|nr:GntR family transcriptional regulator [Paraburkholderia domus]MBK5065905.1 GntR family transcriptional regulator [Burkholderia sp. R-70199]CAE6959287.1 HTH-type transcriptional regulator McbR [Paraburkholderia domus]